MQLCITFWLHVKLPLSPSLSPPLPLSLPQPKNVLLYPEQGYSFRTLGISAPPTMISQEIIFEKVTALTLNKIPLKIIFPNN